MSRLFDGSNDYLSGTSGITGFPFTLAVWYKLDTTAEAGGLLGIGNSASSLNNSAYIFVDASGYVNAVTRTTSASTATSSPNGSTTAQIWRHAAGTFASASSRFAFYNGTKGTEQTTTRSATTPLQYSAAAATPGGTTNYFDGRLAYPAIWNVVLSDAEIAMLAAGVMPWAIRPQNLVRFWPYIGRHTADIDIIAGTTFTNNGAGGEPQADEPPVLWTPSRKLFLPAGGPIIRSTGLASETDKAVTSFLIDKRAQEADTALALARIKFRTYSTSTSTNSALVPYSTIQKIRATDLASTTDTSLNLNRVKIRPVGFQAPQGANNTSLALTRVKVKSVGLATETDSAVPLSLGGRIQAAAETDSSFALTRTKIKAIGFATSQNTSLNLTCAKVKATGLATSTNTSFNPARIKIRAAGLSTSTNTGLNLTRVKIKAIGSAISTNAGLNLSRIKIRATGLSSSANTAYALARGAIQKPVGLATQTNTSLSLAQRKIRIVGLGSSVNSALAPSVGIPGLAPGLNLPLVFRYGAVVRQFVSTGLAVETDVSYNLGTRKYLVTGLAISGNAAQSLGIGDAGWYIPLGYLVGVPSEKKFIPTGHADSTNSAFNLAVKLPLKKIPVRWAQEAPIASTLTRVKAKPVGVATSVNTSFSISVGYGLATGLAVETDTAIARPFGSVSSIGVATSLNTALRLVYRRVITVGLAVSLSEALRRPLTPTIVRTVELATQTNTAVALSVSPQRTIGQATETDTAFSRTFTRPRATQLSTGTNTAIALHHRKIYGVRAAVSVHSAQKLFVTHVRPITHATSGNTAKQPLILSRVAVERDVALFQEVYRGGELVFPRLPSAQGSRRMWNRFIA